MNKEQIIEILERILKKNKIIPKAFARKLQLNFAQHNIINMHGAPKVGKSVFAKLTAQQFTSALIIDYNDIRNKPHLEYIEKNIFSFMAYHKINFLALDHVSPLHIQKSNILQELEKYNIPTLIISKEPISNIYQQQLHGIDFEEYMSFTPRNNHLQHLFNNFLLDGTLPEIAFTEEYKKDIRKQEIIKSAQHSTAPIITFALKFMGHALSIHHLYTQLKKQYTISKDSVYHFIQLYQRESLIYLMPKLNHNHAAKKLYFWDFSLFNAISYERNFIALFENIIFLELIKNDSQIYYSESCDFIISHTHYYIGIIAAPFLSTQSISKRINKTQTETFTLKHIYILTLGYTQETHPYPTPHTIMPFWEFALGDREW